MFKRGDVVKVVDEYVSYPYNLEYGSVHIVQDISEMSGNINVGIDGQYWNASRFVLFNEGYNKEDFAAAFNAWMDDYMNNPQAYEDSHDSAVRHLKEKLNGQEPSYGAVCAEVLVKYLNKLESK